MASLKLSTDSVRSLIQAVSDYQSEILLQKQFLLNAANVCDQTLGSDPISKRKIDRLEQALVTLDHSTDYIIEEGLRALTADLDDLERIVEEA